MEYVDLKQLPEDHPLRNTLLSEAKAEYKHIHGYDFKPVEPGRPMNKYTYNTLSWQWTRYCQWRAPKP